MPGRSWSSSTYRYGFNGKENDNEVKGVGAVVDFDDRQYDSRIKLFVNIEMLTIFDVDIKPANVDCILGLTELKRLVLVDCLMPETVDFDRLCKLEELDLNWNGSFRFTENCRLKDLVLRKSDAKDLAFLECKSLETLEMIEGKLSSINGISRLENLRSLAFINVKNTSDFTLLGDLKKLEYLDLRGIKSTINLEFVAKMHNLKWLVLENCNFLVSETLLTQHSLRGVKILKRTKLTDIEKPVISTFPDSKYGYFRFDNVTDRLAESFKNSDSASKN